MKPFDERRIDPTAEELVGLLVAATRKANGRSPQPQLGKSRDQWDRFVRRQRKKAEGRQAFRGRGEPAPRVEASWWTDRLGRRHWRVVGRRADFDASHRERIGRVFTSSPLWHVYPERLLAREAGGRRDLLAACACGAAGTPAQIGWVGGRCGPCHDRREEGLPPLPDGPPVTLPVSGRDVILMAFACDTHLLTAEHGGRVLAWPLAGGPGQVLRRRGGCATALAASSTGLVALSTGDGRVALTRLGEEGWRTVRLPVRGIDEFQFTARGDRMAVRGDRGVVLLDPHAPSAAPVGVLAREIDTWLFLPDGSGYAFEEEARGVGRAVFGGGPGGAEQVTWLTEGYGPNEMEIDQGLAVSPDGRWLAINSGWDEAPGVRVCAVDGGGWASLAGGFEFDELANFEFTADSKLAVAADHGTLGLWDPATGSPLGKLALADLHGRFGRYLFSATGEWLAFADEDGPVTAWPWRRLLGC
ncbi:MAG: WD40 repeat domain-containing protein [Gemmataceae bacterium]